jgi:uncharacterized protein (TIGR03083 family)
VKTCHRRELAWYCGAFAAEAGRFADVVDGFDLGAAVPTCPDWTVAELVRHLGGIHRWAGQMVRDRAQTRLSREDLERDPPANGAYDAAWIRSGARRVLPWFEAADPDVAMWAWGADKHARFWPRRMLHETTVHRTDAEAARGVESPIEPGIAVDGVDEFLDNLPHAEYFAPAVAELKGTGTIRWVATDAGERWRITLSDGGFDWDHEDGPADVTVSGTAADMMLLAYGRRSADDRDRFTVEGDGDLLAWWLARSSI